MDNIYAIYSYKFVESKDYGDWTQGVHIGTDPIVHSEKDAENPFEGNQTGRSD